MTTYDLWLEPANEHECDDGEDCVCAERDEQDREDAALEVADARRKGDEFA